MNWLTTEDLEDYEEQKVSMGAPFEKFGDDGFGYITRSRERVRGIVVNELRANPGMTVSEFNALFDRRGQSAVQVVDTF